jgi:hypothetical protein
MLLGPLQQTGRLELLHDPPASLVAVQAVEPVRRRQADPGFRRHDVDAGKLVATADLEIGGIVRRSHLHRTGPEAGVHRVIGHNGNEPIHQRKPDLEADEPAVALVLRMHGNGGVAQHGLGPGGGDRQVATAIGQRVPQVPEVTVDLLLLRLLVGERRQTAGAPVDDIVAAIDQTVLVELNEHLADRPGEAFIQGEVGARPVGGAADRLELFQDGCARLPNMMPHPLDERVAAQIESGESLLGQQPLDHVLRGDSCMVGARNPKRPPPSHPLEPDEHVLHRIVEAVAHVEDRRHIGRRHHDDVGLGGPGSMALGRKETPVGPPPVEIGLDCGWIVLRSERLGHAL